MTNKEFTELIKKARITFHRSAVRFALERNDKHGADIHLLKIIEIEKEDVN